ncbi:MAG: ImuA family protein [Inquilinaceae bacterium]
MAERAAVSLERLRDRIARIEGRPRRLEEGEAEPGWIFGAAAIDRHVGDLSRRDVHLFRPAAAADIPAIQALGAALLARLALGQPRRPVLWVQTKEARRLWGTPSLAGLAGLGAPAERVIFVEAARPALYGQAMEEGLRSGRLAAVVGVGPPPAFVDSRRLRLRAGERATPCLLLATRDATTPVAAATGWRVAAQASGPNPDDPAAPGRPRWRLELMRAGHCAPAAFEVEWDDATVCFHMVAGSAAGAAGAGTFAPEPAVELGVKRGAGRPVHRLRVRA